ncbi:hypothetical protein J6590_037113 [Homalodisca vitripennis]|nr:hypothetical protein J6590_037113 [Homalodisca vitripennis]
MKNRAKKLIKQARVTLKLDFYQIKHYLECQRKPWVVTHKLTTLQERGLCSYPLFNIEDSNSDGLVRRGPCGRARWQDMTGPDRISFPRPTKAEYGFVSTSSTSRTKAKKTGSLNVPSM